MTHRLLHLRGHEIRRGASKIVARNSLVENDLDPIEQYILASTQHNRLAVKQHHVLVFTRRDRRLLCPQKIGGTVRVSRQTILAYLLSLGIDSGVLCTNALECLSVFTIMKAA